MKCYSIIKKNGIQSFAGLWMGLEVIVLRKLRKLRKTNIAYFTHMQNLDIK
jgi:hypothetical protein